MTVPGNLSSPLLATAAGGAAAAAGPIKSVRFNDDDSAYLDRTPSSASNRKKWTWSSWVKKCKNGATQCLFYGGTSNSNLTRIIHGPDSLELQHFDNGSFTGRLETNANYTDPSAWYHFVVAVDTTQGTASNRIKLYVNGVLQDSFLAANYPSQNLDLHINNTNKHSIAVEDAPGGAKSYYFDGYMADVYHIDGQQLDCTSFGAFDSNGVWQAAAYSGTFGTNGFHLFDFANESGIGNDSSGNDNDFTVNNISEVVPTGNYASGISIGNNTLTDYDKNSVVDGDLSTFYADRPINNNGLNFSSIPQASTSVRILYNCDNCTFATNAGTLTTGAQSKGWRTISTTYPFTLTSISASGGIQFDGFFIYAIEVDGTVLVDSSFGGNNDVLRDVPTNGNAADDTGAGSEVSGNYCTFNPLKKSAGATLSNGNLQAAIGSTGGTQQTYANFGMSSGKWFWEVQSTSGNARFWGIAKDTAGLNVAPGENASSYGWGDFHGTTGEKWHNGSFSSYGTYPSLNDIVGVAFDADNGTLTYYLNGVSQGVAFTGISGTYFPVVGIDNTTHILNAGQRAFAHSAPSGFSPLCTTLLPTPTIADGSAHFESKLYTGNGSTNALTMANSSMSPDWVWIHARSTTGAHEMFDIIRGANKALESNFTNAEATISNSLTSFDSNGFTLGSSGVVNDNNVTYVAWCFDGGSSNATNTSGSISSTVRANIAAGFSIVKWTGSGAAATVGHGLGTKPHFIISHRISGSGQWPTYNSEITATKYMYLNSTIEARTYQHFWNNTEPTSSVFSIGNDADVSTSGGTHIAYCFAPVEGYQAMGKYIGTGDPDGTKNGAFVYTGFRSALVMIKRISNGESWVFYDTSRDTHNPTVTRAWADLTLGDSTNTGHYIEILSNGFKIRSGGGLLGSNGDEYFYWAVAENPFQANGGLAR